MYIRGLFIDWICGDIVINNIYLLFFQDDLGNDFGGYNEYDDFI